MSTAPSRRTVLTGAGAAAVLVVAGGAAGFRMMAQASTSPDSEAEDYAGFLAAVRDDYINGRVVEHNGWVLSQHEADTIDSRTHEGKGNAKSAAIG